MLFALRNLLGMHLTPANLVAGALVCGQVLLFFQRTRRTSRWLVVLRPQDLDRAGVGLTRPFHAFGSGTGPGVPRLTVEFIDADSVVIVHQIDHMLRQIDARSPTLLRLDSP